MSTRNESSFPRFNYDVSSEQTVECKRLNNFCTAARRYIVPIDRNAQQEPRSFKQIELRKRCGEYQQIYENLAKDKSENKSSEEVHINDENEVELGNISSDEDNEFVPIEKERSIVLNYSSDSDTE
ncbi:hypothetical protein K0M31_014881 [Melipona bicolor]|uniref:Uncharacterized protein n=1 Tax=Melipona bicolor TaxID=60889 RepID=A0AA40FHD3_9HYME|nr:hypothetical protein K0M31_014881 [Melipona bicolor]